MPKRCKFCKSRLREDEQIKREDPYNSAVHNNHTKVYICSWCIEDRQEYVR